MRKLITTVIAAVGLMVVAAPLAAQAQAPTRIGYIDTRRVIQEAPGAVAARDTLSREMQAVQAEMQAMDDSLRSMVANYQQRALVMSDEAKQRQEQQLMQARDGFQARADSLQQHAGQRQQQLMEPIMTHIERIIGEVRQAQGFAIVFDLAADAIVSADPALDLTDMVIARLRAAGPAASSR
jgi:outer membrane protein